MVGIARRRVAIKDDEEGMHEHMRYEAFFCCIHELSIFML
jgi:hypothetical protein